MPNYLRHPTFPHARPASTAHPKLASPSSDETNAACSNASASNGVDIRATTGAISRLSLESGVNADCSTVTTPSQTHVHNNGGGGGPHAPDDVVVSNHGVNARASIQHPQQLHRPTSSLLSPHQHASPHQHLPLHQHLPPHQHHLPYPGYNPDELVVKVRIEGHPDPDFIEVELPRGPGLDFELLLDILSEELAVPKNLISKVRKRPDTMLRKDRDLMRLRDFEELEIVVSQTPCVNSPSNGGRYVPKYGGVQARILY